MKHQYKLLSIMLAGGLMTACSSDEPGALSTPVPAQFSAQIGSTVSRASGTSWATGDQIGISDNSAVFTNVPYTTTGAGVFTPAGTGRIFYNSTDPVTFSAYYPFNADGGIITASTADQSKQTEFDFLWAQATGNYADPAVHFNFRHCMSRLSLTFTNSGNVDLSDLEFKIGGLALEGTFDIATGEAAASADAVAVELSVTPSEASADRAVSSVILFPQTATDATITITAEGSNFISALPITDLRPGTNYRLSVKVSANGIEVNDLNSSEWADGGSEDVAVNNVYMADDLKIGDYYYSDGSWSDGGLRKRFANGTMEWEATKPSPTDGKTVIGIVFQTDPARIGEAEKTALAAKGIDKPHGLVMAVGEAGGFRWGNTAQDENSDGASGEPFKDNVTRPKAYYADISGYASTKYIIDTYSTDVVKNTYSAFYQAVNFGSGPTSDYAAPGNTTGWFLPAIGQWWDITENLGALSLASFKDNTETSRIMLYGISQNIASAINKHMEPLRTGNYTGFKYDDSIYWASSEFNGDGAVMILFSESRFMILGADKGNQFQVRPVLAF